MYVTYSLWSHDGSFYGAVRTVSDLIVLALIGTKPLASECIWLVPGTEED